MTINTTGQGFKLQRGAATGSSLPAPGADSFVDVLDIQNLKPPSATRETTEEFVLDLVASKKFVGPVTWSPVTATLLRAWGDAVHDSLENDSFAAGGTRRNYRIIANDPSTEIRDFVGIVSKFELDDITNQPVVKYQLEIAVDGGVTITR